MWRKFIRIIMLANRLRLGGDAATIYIPEANWNHQYKMGKWKYLSDGTPNLALIVWYITKQAHNRPHAPLRILDIGCGNGALPKFLSTTNINFIYTGVDISSEALSQARSEYPAGHYIQQSAEEKLETDDVFDIIVFNETLYYVNAKKALSTHAHLLTNDGCFIISMYNTLRTRYIWWLINHLVIANETYSVQDMRRKVTWNIKICSPVLKDSSLFK